MDRIKQLLYDFEPEPDPNPEPDAPGNGPTVLSAEEVRGIVSDAIDDRLNALGIGDRLSKLDILDDLLGKSNESPDHSSLLGEIDKLIQKRTATFARSTGGSSDAKTEPESNVKRGPLGRWLSA